MTTKSTPVRIDAELYASARQTGEVMSRSAAQQVTHWARIGRALETNPSISSQRVEEVLAGTACYDDLVAEEQAMVRASWEKRVDDARERLRLDEKFIAEGRAYAELDENGEVVVRHPAV